MPGNYTYTGMELELFRNARHWKLYFSSVIKPYISGHVLEVGAGIGSTTQLLNDGSPPAWTLLEPDQAFCDQLQTMLNKGELPSNSVIRNGMIADLQEKFDTIIYIDVLEHIEKDAAELENAMAAMKPGARLIVLSPAFQHIFSPFDKEIGHYRRYTRKRMRMITPGSLEMVSNRYYDSVGYFASLLNRVLLRKKYPGPGQVKFWDNWMVPVSRLTDKLVFHSFGKSIITVWQKPG